VPVDHVRALLLAGYHHAITAPNADAAFEQVQNIAGVPLDPVAFHEAVATCLRDGLILDPVRLTEQSLQCHWQLELTQAGVARARDLTGA
jgi:hypothetical protein